MEELMTTSKEIHFSSDGLESLDTVMISYVSLGYRELTDIGGKRQN